MQKKVFPGFQLDRDLVKTRSDALHGELLVIHPGEPGDVFQLIIEHELASSFEPAETAVERSIAGLRSFLGISGLAMKREWLRWHQLEMQAVAVPVREKSD